MKNLSTKMNSTALITLLTKFQPPPLNDEVKHSFYSYSLSNFQTGLEESFQKVYTFALFRFNICDLQLVAV